MRQERLRSERYGTPLSLVMIDIDGLLDVAARTNRGLSQAFLKQLTGILKNSTRESDIKGWYAEGKVALLVTNTDESGARALVKNLIRSLADHLSSGGDIQEQGVSQFVTLSSLQTGRSYLAKDQLTGLQQSYSVDFASRRRATPHSSQRSATLDVAAMTWPFSVEILNQEQVRKLELRVKRAIDIVGSVAGIILSAPLMLVIAPLIKLTSAGPVLFRQERLGFLGKPFTFLKFRSMETDSDPSLHQDYVSNLIKGENDSINKGTAEQPLYKITDDPRITPIGNFLRKSSLDEIPQFFNVLKGDMSLVGPRPPIPYECDEYKGWHCRRVLEVKPGITGLWQVSGRSSTTFDEMVRLDLTYVRTWSLWLDIKIILKTWWAVISARGGY